MTCLYSDDLTVVVCRPSITGLGEARRLYCVGCRQNRRHWLHATMDAWYEPDFYWRCDTCGRSLSCRNRRAPMPPRKPLLWSHAVTAMMEREFAVTPP